MELAAITLVITALLAYVNHRFIKLPTTIGVMSIALALSLAFIALDRLGFTVLSHLQRELLGAIDFSQVLMQGMLSMLLFAGALHIDLSELRSYRWQVGLLAVGGTIISTVIIAYCVNALLPWFGVHLPFTYCLLFGALISPTDPIAVMGILKTAGAPKSVEIVIAGESLFNDGVGVVLFVFALSLLGADAAPSPGAMGLLMLREAGGGIVYGLALGYITYRLLRSIDSYQEEVLLTLAAVIGGYALADQLGVSGPLAMVVAGLVIGNQGRAFAMSDVTRQHLDMFWELIDSMLNSVLFVLIGFEIIVLSISSNIALAAAAALIVTLAARVITILIPLTLFRRAFGLPRRAWTILTWGGLRGGISVALALSLPVGDGRNVVVTLTYIIVVFSILVQGLTIGPLVRQVIPGRATQTDAA